MFQFSKMCFLNSNEIYEILYEEIPFNVNIITSGDDSGNDSENISPSSESKTRPVLFKSSTSESPMKKKKILVV